MMKIELDVSVYDDSSEGPNFARVDISETLKDRILLLSTLVGAGNASRIAEFDATPEWLELYEDGDDEKSEIQESDWRVETEIIHVSAGSFYWTAYLKHTNITVQTDIVRIKDILGDCAPSKGEMIDDLCLKLLETVHSEPLVAEMKLTELKSKI